MQTCRSLVLSALSLLLLPTLAWAQSDEVLFVRGDGQPPQSYTDSGDEAIVNQLTALGYQVTVVQDSAVSLSDAQGKALVVISETVSSGSVASGLAPIDQLPVAILCLEPYLLDDLRMTGTANSRTTPAAAASGGIDNGDWGNAPPHTQIYVVDASHPLAAGFSAGFNTISPTPVELGFGVPNGNAQVIATLDDPANPATPAPAWWNQDQAPAPALGQRAAIFVYEAGAGLVGGAPAPARRVAWFGRHGAAPNLTPAGLGNLVAAIDGTGGFKRIQSGSWSNGASWEPSGVPTASDQVLVYGAAALNPGGATVRGFALRPGLDLTLTSSLSVSEDAVLRGRLVVPAGVTLTVQGELELPAGATLELQGGALQLGARLRVEGTLVLSGGATLGASGAARVDLEVAGALEVNGASFSGLDVDGLHVLPGAELRRLRNAAFSGIDPDGAASFLTIEAASLNLNAPGCTFAARSGGQANVELIDSDGGGDVVLNLEHRGSNGAGAGPAYEREVNGAALNWVWGAPDTTAGTAVGFPQVAYDLNTFALYATYVSFRDVDSAGNDRIYVFDSGEQGNDQGYGFRVTPAQGELIGIWWDTLPGTGHVVWATTDSGRLLRWTDSGAGSSQTPSLDLAAGGVDAFTSPPLTDGTLVYAAGLSGGAPRLFAFQQSDGALAWSLPIPQPITSELAAELDLAAGATKVFAGASGTGDATPIDATFPGGASEGFSYLDDTFYGTSNSAWAFGSTLSGGGQGGDGALRVTLGQQSNGQDVDDMSGGWRTSFSVPSGATAVSVQVTFRARITSFSETNEFVQALLSVDGTLYGSGGAGTALASIDGGSGNGSGFESTGWQTRTLSVPATVGNRVLTVGGYLNQRTVNNEYAQVDIDRVLVTVSIPGGVLYRIDTMTQMVEVSSSSPAGAVRGSPFPLSGTGMWAADDQGRVTALDHTALGMPDLPGWPLQPSTTPVLGHVFVDFLSTPVRVFWANEAGQVFGYDGDGAALGGFPVTPLGSEAIRGWPLLDVGTLWVANQAGEVAAFAVNAPGVIVSPDYRFGASVPRLAQGYAVGRLQLSNGAGKFLILERE